MLGGVSRVRSEKSASKPAADGLRPRTKPPEERRHELMSAAQRLFLEHGVGPTTIEQITTAAGVAKGTFYLYFTSKEDVLAALAARFAQEQLGKIEAAIAVKPESDWQGKLAAWAGAAVASYLDAIRLHDIVFYGHRPAAREDLGSNIVIDHLAKFLQAGAKAGAWAKHDFRFLAVFLFTGLHGVVDDAYTPGEQVNRSRLTRRLEELCFRAVGLI
jgi:AcrR family transcriptional regulator